MHHRAGHHAPVPRWSAAHDAGRLSEVFIAGVLAEGGAVIPTTVLHEAAHVLAHVRGIKDTRPRWAIGITNRRFAALAKELGASPAEAATSKARSSAARCGSAFKLGVNRLLYRLFPLTPSKNSRTTGTLAWGFICTQRSRILSIARVEAKPSARSAASMAR